MKYTLLWNFSKIKGGFMKIDGALNVWGKGQLIAYSGIDGETDYDDGLVLRSREEGGFDLCLPEPGRILRRAERRGAVFSRRTASSSTASAVCCRSAAIC